MPDWGLVLGGYLKIFNKSEAREAYIKVVHRTRRSVYQGLGIDALMNEIYHTVEVPQVCEMD